MVRFAVRQVAFEVAVDAQSLTVEGASGAEAEPARSLDVTAIVCTAFIAPLELSLLAVGGGGTMAVKVPVAVWPTASVTRYVTGVTDPVVAPARALKVTTPVAGTSVYVPAPAIVTVLFEEQVVVEVLNKQVIPVPDVTSPVPLARPEAPVIEVKDTDDEGNTDLLWLLAEIIGAETFGVRLAALRCA